MVIRAELRHGCGAGWFNLLGQAAVTAGIDFALASHISAMWVLSNGYILSQSQLLLVYFSASLLCFSRLMGPRACMSESRPCLLGPVHTMSSETVMWVSAFADGV